MLLQWVLVAALLVGAPALPVQTLDDVRARAVNIRPVGVCAGEVVVVAELAIDGREFELAVTERRFVLADAAPGDDTDVWVGRVEQGRRLVAEAHMTYGEWQRRYPTVCGALVGRAV